MDKAVTLKEAENIVAGYRKKGQKVVFTNGCFDIIHAGHVKYLEAAKACGDILILGLNSDASIRQIKGEKRPVIHQEHRIAVISALGCIDHVIVFDEPDPGSLIQTLLPDVLVKGADWSEEEIIGADVVKENGGCVERIQLEPQISTTQIIERIGRLYYGQQ